MLKPVLALALSLG